MTDVDRLYRLMPAVYRQHDVARGFPLRDLLRVLGEQVSAIEADIDQLYENWFIETCDDWVVPYIGELIGYQSVESAGPPGDVSSAQGRVRNRVLTPRREVGNTIRYRRRKGALALLELLAADVAGWPARAVECSRGLAVTQAVNHRRPAPPAMVDIRDAEALELLEGPFAGFSRTPEVRRISSTRSPGLHHPSGVALFIWRLKPYTVTRAPAYCAEEAGNHCFTFSLLGNSTQLVTRPVAQTDPTELAGELNVPAPIRRRRFERRDRGQYTGRTSEAFYGLGKSVMIWLVGDDPGVADAPVPIEQVVPADLTDWEYHPKAGDVAVDPVLGRLAFSPGHAPDGGVRVSYCYAFSADMGGGEYPRRLRQGARRRPDPAVDAKMGARVPAPPESPTVAAARLHRVPLLYRVGRTQPAGTAIGVAPDYPTLTDALKQWDHDAPADAIVEIVDSDVYEEQIEIGLGDRRLELRGASGVRPVLRLVDRRAGRPDALTVSGDPGSELTLDGLLVTGRGLEVRGPVSKVVIRHSTLVPGWALRHNCEPYRPAEPSITLDHLGSAEKAGTELHSITRAAFRASRLAIDHSIVGSIRVIQDEVGGEPVEVSVADSVVDATAEKLAAVDAPADRWAHATLTVVRSTIIGRILTHAIDLAENSIFAGDLRVARRQAGCVRFCFVPPGSRTPRRFNCQPDTAATALSGAARADVELRVRPEFTSTRYGTPDYCQLAETCPEEIARGADDQSEMGAFHDLFQPQRRATLQARLEEFVPAGVDVGVISVT